MKAFYLTKLPLVVTLSVVVPITTIHAQQILGGSGQSSVVVDYSIIDSLGRAPNIPQVLLGVPGASAVPANTYSAPAPRFPIISSGKSSSKTGGIVLRPPKAAKRRVTKRTRKTRKAIKRPLRTARRSPASVGRKIRPLTPPKVLAPPKAVTAPPPPKVAAPARPVPVAPAVPAAPKVKPPPKQQVSTVALSPPAPLKIVPQNSVPAAPKIAKPKSQPKTRVAALPPPDQVLRAGSTTRIGFSAGSAKLNSDASARLKGVSDSLKKNGTLRIQLLAYAGSKDGSASQARRLSLSRALAARSYLIDAGIRSTRIDVRALGNKSGNGPTDRIDIIVTTR